MSISKSIENSSSGDPRRPDTDIPWAKWKQNIWIQAYFVSKKYLWVKWWWFDFCCQTAKLPKWFGERPGKKAGEPDSPEDDDEGGADVPAEVEEEEEEEEEEVRRPYKTQ